VTPELVSWGDAPAATEVVEVRVETFVIDGHVAFPGDLLPPALRDGGPVREALGRGARAGVDPRQRYPELRRVAARALAQLVHGVSYGPDLTSDGTLRVKVLTPATLQKLDAALSALRRDGVASLGRALKVIGLSETWVHLARLSYLIRCATVPADGFSVPNEVYSREFSSARLSHSIREAWHTNENWTLVSVDGRFGTHRRVEGVCSDHGPFELRHPDAQHGAGCPPCGIAKRAAGRREWTLGRANETLAHFGAKVVAVGPKGARSRIEDEEASLSVDHGAQLQCLCGRSKPKPVGRLWEYLRHVSGMAAVFDHSCDGTLRISRLELRVFDAVGRVIVRFPDVDGKPCLRITPDRRQADPVLSLECRRHPNEKIDRASPTNLNRRKVHPCRLCRVERALAMRLGDGFEDVRAERVALGNGRVGKVVATARCVRAGRDDPHTVSIASPRQLRTQPCSTCAAADSKASNLVRTIVASELLTYRGEPPTTWQDERWWTCGQCSTPFAHGSSTCPA
jgi:hypothetical protein